MTKPISFLSIDLQTTFEQSRDVLENIVTVKNNISNDIKTLEKYLKTICLIESFHYLLPILVTGNKHPFENLLAVLSKHTLTTRIAENINDNQLNMIVIQEEIIWNIEKKRLYYIQKKAQGFYSVESCKKSEMVREEFKTTLERPLIECPFDIRQRVSLYLPDFIRLLKKQYESEVAYSNMIDVARGYKND